MSERHFTSQDARNVAAVFEGRFGQKAQVVKVLNWMADQLDAKDRELALLQEEIRVREESQIPVIPRAALERLERAERELAEQKERIDRVSEVSTDAANAADRAERERDRLKTLLARLSEWDHMQSAADGPYWLSEIAQVLDGDAE